MKLRDLIAQTKPSPTNWLDGDDIAEEVGVNLDYSTDLAEHGFQETLVISWLCTDTYVGLSVIFLDGEAVLYTWQPARKHSKEVCWLSEEAVDKVRKRLLEIPRSAATGEVSIADLDKELSDIGFQVDYGSQLLTADVVYNDRPARVMKRYGLRYGSPSDWDKVDLEVDGVIHEKVSLEEVFVPYNFGGAA